MVKRIDAQLIAPSASSEEAAAIIAALELFERDRAPQPPGAGGPADRWARAAMLENVVREQCDVVEPWINT